MILFREPREALKHHGTAGLCFLAILLFSIPGTLLAQMDQGTITGIVQDNTGAAVQGRRWSCNSRSSVNNRANHFESDVGGGVS